VGKWVRVFRDPPPLPLPPCPCDSLNFLVFFGALVDFFRCHDVAEFGAKVRESICTRRIFRAILSFVGIICNVEELVGEADVVDVFPFAFFDHEAAGCRTEGVVFAEDGSVGKGVAGNGGKEAGARKDGGFLIGDVEECGEDVDEVGA